MLNGNMMTDRSTENMEIEHQPLAYMTCTQDINIYYASVMEYHTTAPEKHADLPMKWTRWKNVPIIFFLLAHILSTTSAMNGKGCLINCPRISQHHISNHFSSPQSLQIGPNNEWFLSYFLT